MNKKILYLALIFSTVTLSKEPKIIGLMPVRNEGDIIDQSLKALSLYVDSIVVLDDASTDDTVAKIKSIAQECKVESIIEKKEWYRDEPADANKLLEEGRRLGGTHFIRLDADEMFTANLLKNNYLRERILQLQSGDKYVMTWIQLWRSPYKYRFDSSVWSSVAGDFIFCDDGQCFYESGFIHTSRSPQNLTGKVLNFDVENSLRYSGLFKTNENIVSIIEPYALTLIMIERYLEDVCGKNAPLRSTASQFGKIPKLLVDHPEQFNKYRIDFSSGVMHFQFVDWENLLCKQAWYRCIEKIRNPDIDVEFVNKIYGDSKNEADIRLKNAPKEWLIGYSFFKQEPFLNRNKWQKKQVEEWFNQYGFEYFQDLDIWDINW